MKKLLIALSLFFAIGLFSSTQAQNISINVNVNLDKQPAWGPTGYDYASFYYLPDINIYYDVTSALFYYLSGSQWISTQYLPDKYRKYDLYGLYKVVINESQPWLKNKTHKKSYSQYKGDKTQQPIRYSSDSKYNNSKSNTNSWVNTNKNNTNKNSNNNTSTSKKDNNKNQNNNTQGNNNSGRTSNSNNNSRR